MNAPLKVGRFLVSPLIVAAIGAPFLVFLCAKAFDVWDFGTCLRGVEPPVCDYRGYIAFEWFAIFSVAGMFGALGTFVSAATRSLHTEDDQRATMLSLVLVHIVGAVFGVLVVLLFIGGFVQGNLFPRLSADSWQDLLFRVPDWGKLMVWSFIAGFSERMIPSLLENLTKRFDAPPEPKQPTA